MSLVIAAVVLARLGFSSTHTHVTTDADSATLLGHNTRQGGALRQTRELLRAEDGEGDGLDFQTEIHALHGLS